MSTLPTKKVRLQKGYGLPIFSIGAIYYTIETEDGEEVMTLSITVRGDTAEEQKAHFEAERTRIAGYVDLINKGIDANALAAKLAELPARSTTDQEG